MGPTGSVLVLQLVILIRQFGFKIVRHGATPPAQARFEKILWINFGGMVGWLVGWMGSSEPERKPDQTSAQLAFIESGATTFFRNRLQRFPPND